MHIASPLERENWAPITFSERLALAVSYVSVKQTRLLTASFFSASHTITDSKPVELDVPEWAYRLIKLFDFVVSSSEERGTEVADLNVDIGRNIGRLSVAAR